MVPNFDSAVNLENYSSNGFKGTGHTLSVLFREAIGVTMTVNVIITHAMESSRSPQAPEFSDDQAMSNSISRLVYYLLSLIHNTYSSFEGGAI